MSFAAVKLYGSDTNYGKTIAKSTLDADVNVVSVDLPTIAIDLQPKITSVNKEYVGGNTQSYITDIRSELSPETEPIDYPSVITDYNEFCKILPLYKRFLYIYFDDYKIVTSEIAADSTKCMQVYFSGYEFAHDHNTGTKTIKYNLVEA